MIELSGKEIDIIIRALDWAIADDGRKARDCSLPTYFREACMDRVKNAREVLKRLESPLRCNELAQQCGGVLYGQECEVSNEKWFYGDEGHIQVGDIIGADWQRRSPDPQDTKWRAPAFPGERRVMHPTFWRKPNPDYKPAPSLTGYEYLPKGALEKLRAAGIEPLKKGERGGAGVCGYWFKDLSDIKSLSSDPDEAWTDTSAWLAGDSSVAGQNSGGYALLLFRRVAQSQNSKDKPCDEDNNLMCLLMHLPAEEGTEGALCGFVGSEQGLAPITSVANATCLSCLRSAIESRDAHITEIEVQIESQVKLKENLKQLIDVL